MKEVDFAKYKKILNSIDEDVMNHLLKRLEEELPQLRQNKTIAMLYILQRVVSRVVFAAATSETIDQTVTEFCESVKYMVKAAKYEPKSSDGIH